MNFKTSKQAGLCELCMHLTYNKEIGFDRLYDLQESTGSVDMFTSHVDQKSSFDRRCDFHVSSGSTYCDLQSEASLQRRVGMIVEVLSYVISD